MHHEVDELVYDEDLEPEERAMAESDLAEDEDDDEEPDGEALTLVESEEGDDGSEPAPVPPVTEAETAEEIEEAEASLDEILRERVEGGEAEAYEEEAEEEERVVLTATAEPEAKPRAANEFLCLSCFLIKHRRQLADAERSLCRDCADTA